MRMRRIWKVGVTAAACAAVAACSAGSRGTVKVEVVDFEVDTAKWKEAKRREIPGGMTTVEYVPKGESADDWSELITVFTLADEGGTRGASDVASAELGEARSRCETFEVLAMHESSRESALYEWRVPTPCGTFPVQSALERRIRGKVAIFGLTYRKRAPQLDEGTRQAWLSKLREFSTKEERRAAP